MKLKYLLGILLLGTGAFVVSCDDDDDYTVATGNIITEVTTGGADSITAVSAVLYGTVKDLSQSSSSSYSVGVYYGTSEDPTSSGTAQTGTIDDDGNVTTTVTGLTTGATYYYATYVTLQSRVTTFGEVKSFVATSAQVATVAATGISATKATLEGQFTGVDGLDDESLETGIKIALSEDEVEDGVEYSTGVVNGLLPGTTYWYAAYAVVGSETLYGDALSFTTLSQEMPYVDLGLSVQWASYNLGAESELETGAMFVYGDPTGMETYSSVTADIYGTEYDPAYVLDIDFADESLGKSRMPSYAEIEELIAGTTQTEEEVDGVSGIRFTAANGKSIFLPVTGYREGTTVTSSENGYYWSGNIDATNSGYAGAMSFEDGTVQAAYIGCQYGLAVRPVRPVENVESEETSDGITFDNSKLVVTSNGSDLRLEIYNEWGGTVSSAENCGISDINAFTFSSELSVTFSISGITVSGDYTASLMFCDGTYMVQYWGEGDGSNTATVTSATVTGDGSYTVTLSPSGNTSAGFYVFCIDISGLNEALGWTTEGVTASITSIVLDGTELEIIN